MIEVLKAEYVDIARRRASEAARSIQTLRRLDVVVPPVSRVVSTELLMEITRVERESSAVSGRFEIGRPDQNGLDAVNESVDDGGILFESVDTDSPLGSRLGHMLAGRSHAFGRDGTVGVVQKTVDRRGSGAVDTDLEHVLFCYFRVNRICDSRVSSKRVGVLDVAVVEFRRDLLFSCSGGGDEDGDCHDPVVSGIVAGALDGRVLHQICGHDFPIAGPIAESAFVILKCQPLVGHRAAAEANQNERRVGIGFELLGGAVGNGIRDRRIPADRSTETGCVADRARHSGNRRSRFVCLRQTHRHDEHLLVVVVRPTVTVNRWDLGFVVPFGPDRVCDVSLPQSVDMCLYRPF